MEVVNLMGCNLDCIMVGAGRVPGMSNFQPKLGCEKFGHKFLVIGILCLPKCSKIILDTLGLADLKNEKYWYEKCWWKRKWNWVIEGVYAEYKKERDKGKKEKEKSCLEMKVKWW